MRRAILLLVATGVLGAACTEDPRAERTEAEPPPEGKPRCTAYAGQVPEGFVLERSREFRYPDRIGVRKEYRHPDGRLLVHLLGVAGQLGEHATIADEVELMSGERATIFGDGKNPNWVLAWSGPPPCRQVAVVGNGFSRAEFESTMADAGLLA